MKALFRFYVFLEKAFPGLIFCAIFVVMIMEIGCRLVIRKSFEWNTEFCRYALVWITFIGSVYVRRENAHIKVMALYDWLKSRKHLKLVFAMDLFATMVSLLFYIFIAVYGWKLSSVTARFSSSAMGISQFWLYIATAIGGLLGAFLEAGALYVLLKTGLKADIAGASAGALQGGEGQ